MQRQRSKRQLQVGELVKQLLSEQFMRQEIYDRDSGLVFNITITEVQMSPDLKNATAFVMPLGGSDGGPTVERLNKNAPMVRKFLAGKAHLKYIPNLHFKLDETIEQVYRLEDILHSPKVAQDLVPNET